MVVYLHWECFLFSVHIILLLFGVNTALSNLIALSVCNLEVFDFTKRPTCDLNLVLLDLLLEMLFEIENFLIMIYMGKNLWNSIGSAHI